LFKGQTLTAARGIPTANQRKMMGNQGKMMEQKLNMMGK